jgi:hypothetical protein
MHDSKFWRECHLLAPIVGFSHSEETLIRVVMCRKYISAPSDMMRFLMKVWEEDAELVEHELASSGDDEANGLYMAPQALVSGQAVPLVEPLNLLRCPSQVIP